MERAAQISRGYLALLAKLRKMDPALQPAAHPPPVASRRFTVLVAVAATLIIAGSFIGYSEWKSSQPSMDTLVPQLRRSMNQTLSADEQFRNLGLQLGEITVMRSVGNMFEGQVAVSTRKGTEHSVAVHINYDGETLIWQTDPGAFLFTAQEQLQGTS